VGQRVASCRVLTRSDVLPGMGVEPNLPQAKPDRQPRLKRARLAAECHLRFFMFKIVQYLLEHLVKLCILVLHAFNDRALALTNIGRPLPR
jgi:hypothetical protein